MALYIDARIPVVFAPADRAGADDALLTEAALPDLAARPAGHAAGCTCCIPRGAAAEALAKLFLARVRGEVFFFRRVVVDLAPAAEQAVRAALADDPLVRGRFRLG